MREIWPQNDLCYHINHAEMLLQVSAPHPMSDTFLRHCTGGKNIEEFCQHIGNHRDSHRNEWPSGCLTHIHRAMSKQGVS